MKIFIFFQKEVTKIIYATTLEVLNKVTDMTFETKIELGVALSDEHERFDPDEASTPWGLCFVFFFKNS
ncbi:hypothetical protein Hanom_Chr12g01065171 [Helianthus anomalus]